MARITFLLSALLLLAPSASASVATSSKCPTEAIPALEPATQAFVDAGANSTPIYKLSVPAARAFLENVQAPGSPSLDTVDFKEFNINVGPTGNVNIHLFRPKNAGEKLLPIIAYFHGGGWILGSPNTHRRLVLDLMESTGAAVFFVNYTRAPEAQFPVQDEQSFAAVSWLHAGDNAAKLGLDHQRTAFAGDSAGGQLAAAVNLMSIQKGRKHLLPRFQVLFYPVTDLAVESCTYTTFAQGPGLAAATLRWMANAFVPRREDRRSILASPLLASEKLLAQFPETLVIVAEVDPLRDEGEAFARRLSASGVSTTAMRALGTVHDFVLLNALANTPAARLAIEVAGSGIRKALAARA